jgi:hypothetical protein
MKCFLSLASLLAAGVLAGCGGAQVDPATQTANAQDRAQQICQSTARSKHLRVSSSEEPQRMSSDRYLVSFKTRDAAGVVSRRCDVDLARGHATIY